RTKWLGERFLTAVGSAFDAIERYPQIFAQVHGEVRRALLSQFPYGVFYRVESKRVVVMAVFDTARCPRLVHQPRKIAKYGERFKATAVKLSGLPGVLIQDVAAALDIHPFMLSLWRKQVREKVIVARESKLDVENTAELRRLKELERR